MPDETPVEQPDGLSPSDILFECPYCTKSLAINIKGAGRTIVCPDCSNEIQVPYPEEPAENGEEAEAGDTTTDDAGPSNGEALQTELMAAHEQINTLRTELDELRFRRRYLERVYTDNIKTIQSLNRQLALIRNTVEQMDSILKEVSQKSADDTQDLG
ncbi:MAG: hypothetical protein HY343_11410 [Lentisphaerae bacterium]|nr:hypothetical protein [Lentisphaerota bacterium]